ncbi:DEAD/DEAH box helicase, partial [Alistipes putredinis]
GITGVQAIVLVPSRELALQIDQVFKSMNTPFKAVSCYGGRPAMEEHRTIKGVQPSVIIGTPGRMNDHLSKQNFDADTVTTLVIDEFDKCLEFGFQ